MLIGMAGPPISGKTTLAAKLFAELKEIGFASEFISEYARFHIAEKRMFSEKPRLTDEDQQIILTKQSFNERIMCGDFKTKTAIITDGPSFLSLLYMSDDYRNMTEVIETAKESALRYDLVFRCPSIKYEGFDANRVHSIEESTEIDKKVDNLLVSLDIPESKIIMLNGSIKDRLSQARFNVLEKICQLF